MTSVSDSAQAVLKGGRFFGHLPRTQIELNSSMSAFACLQQLRSRRTQHVPRAAGVLVAHKWILASCGHHQGAKLSMRSILLTQTAVRKLTCRLIRAHADQTCLRPGRRCCPDSGWC